MQLRAHHLGALSKGSGWATSSTHCGPTAGVPIRSAVQPSKTSRKGDSRISQT